MGKKLLCILIVLSVLLTLPACGRKPDASADGLQTQATKDFTEDTSSTDGTEGTLPQQETTPTGENTEPQPTDSPATKPTETKPTTPPEKEPTTPPEKEPTAPPETKPAEPPVTEPAPEQQTVPQTQPTTPPETQPAPSTEPTIGPQEENPVPTYAHKELSGTEYYQYTLMTEAEKQLYQKLVAGIEKLENEIPVSDISIKSDVGLALFHRVIADHPQFFWVSRRVSVTYNSRTQDIQSFIVLYTDGEKADTINESNQPVAVADREKIAAKRKAVNDKIAQILATIPANYPEVEREKRIHDYISTHVTYDTVAAFNTAPVGAILPHAYDIYGAVIEGKAVCEGYAKLFQYLCYRTGINATQISGIADGGGHMWNAVKIDGDWYEIDMTWNDGDNELLYYRYFNLTHSQMAQDHTANASEIPFPQCNGTKYRYADYYALKLLSTTQVGDNYKAVVDRLIDANGGYLIIYKNGIEMTPDVFDTIVYNDTALVNEYARQRGYRLEFSRSYTIYSDFIYIDYTVQKL